MNLLKKLLKPKELTPRAERLEVSDIHQIKLVIEKNEYPVKNISLYGLAVSLNDKSPLAKDSEINCHIIFKDEPINVKIKVVHINNAFMGISILEGHEEFNQNLNLFFKSELEGLNMRQIAPERLNPRKAGTPHFFYGSDDHEVFYISNNDEVVFFQINFHGFIVEMKLGGELFCGQLEEEEFDVKKHKGSQLIHPSSEVNTDIIKHTIRFLMFIKDLNPTHKKIIVEKLESIA